MNLTYLGLCLACLGVSIAEGMIMSNLFKAAASTRNYRSIAKPPNLGSSLC